MGGLRLVAMSALVCLLGACVDGSDQASESTAAHPASSSTSAQARWSRSDLAVASSAQRVGDLAVLYTHQGDALFLTGLDAQTGTTRWNRPASFGGAQAGIPLTVTVLDGSRVAYFAPVDEPQRRAQLVLLDPAGDATELARSDTKVFYSPPAPCEGNPGSACAWAFTDAGHTALFRLSQGGAAVKQSAEGSVRQSIGRRGLVRFGDQTNVYVGVEKDGALVWSKPERAVFGETHSTNGGWSFDYSEATNTFVGSVGLSVEAMKASSVPMAGSTVTVSLDAATGSVRWVREGIDTFCDTQVTGQDSVDADPLLACQWQSGQWTRDAAGTSRNPDKPTMALTALDVATGQSRWTAPVGGVVLPGKQATPALGLVPDAVLVDGVTGTVRVSLADGAESTPDPTSVAWRRVPVEFAQKVPWRDGVNPDYFTREGQVLEGVLDGQVTDVVTLPLPASVGAHFDEGLTVVTTARRVAAYRT